MSVSVWSQVTSRDSADVFANTSSWTVLETSLRALEHLVPAARLEVSNGQRTGRTRGPL